MNGLVEWGSVLVLLAVGFVFGGRSERRHYKSIQNRETKLLALPLKSETKLQVSEIEDVLLVTGSVAIASDYLKTFIANLKNIFGGRLSSFESLMDRARREATLRLKDQAAKWGADEVIGFRLETSTIRQNGIEILAVGTAVKFKKLST
ncbi:MAG: YbjQ family protein [Oligoflexia bacterium]|nr:YbjQ family protein [Oligoflexia bacterium]